MATATASGSECGASSNLNRRKPTAPSSTRRSCSCSPHCGHACRYAAAAGVNRRRQSEQHLWVITYPFWSRSSCSRVWQSRPVLSGQGPCARRADAIHHRVVQPRVLGFEVHAVASAAEDAQDVPALTAILVAPSGNPRRQRLLGGHDQRCAVHRRTSNTANVSTAAALARRATCRAARSFCVAVVIADRLSALLAGSRSGSEKSRAL
jgi:hypothetical protein